MSTDWRELLDRMLDGGPLTEAEMQILGEALENDAGNAEVADWLRFSDAMTVARPVASTEKIVQSRERLLAKAVLREWREETQGRRQKRKMTFFSRAFLLRAAAVLAIVFLVGWGAVTVSANAVPGDWLYPIKRFTERAKFFLTINAEDKAELRIVFSSERLKEAVKRYQGSGYLDQGLLDEMLQEARLAAESSESLPGISRTLVAGQAAHLSEYQQQMLSGLKTQSAPEHREVFQRYADMCGRRAQWMRGMCGWCGPQNSPGPENPPAPQTPPNRRPWRDMCPMWGN